MADKEWEFGTYRVVETQEAPFIPGQEVVAAVLEPKAPETPYVPPVEPVKPVVSPPTTTPPLPLDLPVYTREAPVPCVIDIETTGAVPTESRITCISAVDVMSPEEIVTFFDLDEETMVKDFIRWYENKGFNLAIGYFVGFDYKYIISRCLKYRIRAEKFVSSDLYDVAQYLTQGKHSFVYGTHKATGLNKWAEYLLGITKLATGEDAILMWEQERYDELMEYNRKDVDITLLLWVLIEYIAGRI